VLWLVETGDMSRTAEGTYVVANNHGKKKKGKSGAGMTAIVAAETDGTATGTGTGTDDAHGDASETRKEASFAARVNGTYLNTPPPSLFQNPNPARASFPCLSRPILPPPPPIP